MASKRTWLITLSALIGLSILAVLLWPSSDALPKRAGYIRIEAPSLEPTSLAAISGPGAVQNFNLAVHGSAQWESKGEQDWGDLVYPWCRGRMQMTYKPVNGNLGTLIDDAHTLAYKHSVVADGISQKLYVNPEKKVYGILFKLQGNAASPIQFFATDSTSHFIRGAAYVFAEPNADSLAPVNAFFEAEVVRFFESLEWGEG